MGLPLIYSSLFVVNLKDKKLINVSKNIDIIWFDWSPDGKNLVFSSSRTKDNIPPDLYLVDFDGNNLTQLTNTPDRNEIAVSWRPLKNKK